VISDTKREVFGNDAESRREEDAIAEIFCYEVMRTFGDRIMRPSARVVFLEKLSQVCQREFLCDKSYSPAYLEKLNLGNYHERDQLSHLKYQNVTHP